MTPKAFSVLQYMAERPGRLVTKQELLDAIWPDIHVTEGVLKRAVLEIRKSLSDPVDEPRFIQTLHRRGYRFLGGASEPQARKEPDPVLAGMVGRSNELTRLDAWFEEALGSSRQIVFVTGEPGLGKSTLVDGWMGALRQSGSGEVAIARGRCLQQFGSGEPYLPVFEALDQLGQTLGRRLVDLLRGRAPTWLMHMPALISLEDRVKLRDEVFGSTRERMLREITDALEALSAEIPLVIALEDLHWSDPSTIDLLTSVARRTTPARLMLLGTYRPADARRDGSPLLAAQNELELHRQCKVMPLAFLSEKETGEYLGTRFPDMDSTEPLAKALHHRTNGNPLYVVSLVEELARSQRIDADPATIREIVPDTLQQMFERQAAQLSDAEQEMLDAAAVTGETFSVAGIATALGSDPGQVESRCEALIRRHLILKRGATVRYPDGAESPGYSFLHALCRDALYRRISPGRRSRLHSLLGRVDEELYRADPKRAAAELAGHFELAGDFGRALRYLRMAADGAAARYSNQEAERYLDRAFAMLERLPEPERVASRMDLLEQRGLMRSSAWDLFGATNDFRLLADEARKQGDARRQTSALIESAPLLMLVDHRQALAAVEEAHASQSGAPDPVFGAVIDAYRSFFRMYLSGWDRELADQSRQAIQTLSSITDLRMRSRIAWMQAAILTFTADNVAACELANFSRECARKANDFFEYFAATLFLHWAAIHLGDLGQALQVAREGAALAARNGSHVPRRWLTVRQRWTEMEAFEYTQALATYEEFAADTAMTSQRHNRPLFLWLAWARLGNQDVKGACEALETLLQDADDLLSYYQLRYPILQARAECAIASGDLNQGKALSEQLVNNGREHHEFAYEARGLCLLAEIALREDFPESAVGYVSQACAALEQCEAWSIEWRVHATGARAFSKLGRARESEQSVERSLAAAHRVASTLEREPALQESFLRRVDAELARRSVSA